MNELDKDLILTAAFYRAETGSRGDRFIEEPTERELGCFYWKEWRSIKIGDQTVHCRIEEISAIIRNDRVIFGGRLVFSC